MNVHTRIEVLRLLQGSATVGDVAKGFREVMLSGSAGTGGRVSQLDMFTSVAPVDESLLDFVIKIGQRQVLAHFECYYKKPASQVLAQGRYFLYLKNDSPTSPEKFGPEPILTIEIQDNGNYAVGDDEFRAWPDKNDIMPDRDTVLTYVAAAVHCAMSEYDG